MTMKSAEHRAEMVRRAERRADRRERALAFAPRLFDRPRPDTTDVEAVKSAKQKRDRRAMRRFREAANGGWRHETQSR